MGFGVGTGLISKTTSREAQVAEKMDNVGKITDMTLYGAKKTVEEVAYADAEDTSVVSGANGATDLVTNSRYEEVSTDYSKLTLTKVSAV